MRLTAHLLKTSLLGSASLLGALQAGAQVSTSLAFNPADSARTHMDIAGAWDGSADATASGDRFGVVISNGSATDPAFDVIVSADLPAGFSERTGALNLSLDGPACGAAPSVSVSRAIDTLTFDFGGYDLPASCNLSLDFGVIAPAGTPAGTYSVSTLAEATSTDGGTLDQSATASQGFTVRAGAVLLEKSPGVTSSTVGSSVTWDISVTNSGLGALFDVQLDEAGLGAGLTLNSIAPTSPVSPAPSVNSTALSIPYLAPGETLSADVTATVALCDGLTNSVALTERTGTLSDSADASVQLQLQTPFVEATIGSTQIAFGGTGTITIGLDNTGDGDASNLVVDTNLESAPLNVVSVSSGWSYTASNGQVTRTAPLAAGEEELLTITVEDSSTVCTAPGSIGFTVTTQFEDQCATPFATPAQVGSVGSEAEPSVSLAVAGPERLSLGESAALTLTASAVDAATLDTDPVPVTYTLPDGIQDGAILSASSGSVVCTGACGAGDTVTWSIPRADLAAGAETLTIGISASDDPCDAGLSYASSGTIAGTYSSGTCNASDGDGYEFILSSSTRALVVQDFNASAEPFETGSVDDGDGLREEGEGEEGGFLAGFSFPGDDSGVWASSTYADDFGGLSGVTLTASSLEYQLNSGAWTAVPGGSVSTNSTGFTIDLDFIAAVDGDASVAGDALNFRYSATAPDSVFGVGTSIRVEQFSTLTLQNGTEGASACVPGGPGTVTYSMGDYVTWQRAVGDVAVTLSDTVIDVCEAVDATVTISNETDQLQIRNLLASLGLGTDFELVTPSVPTYGGGLGGGASVTYDDGAAGGPTVSLIDETLTGTGTFVVPLRRKATATSQGGGVTASIDYDDNQTAPAGGQSFSASASATPQLVRNAKLELFVSPSDLPVSSDTASWGLTVTNTGSGVAFGAEVSDTVPAGLSISSANLTAMDAVNGAYTATAAGSTVTWAIGDLPPGESVDLTVIADVAGSTCSIPAGANTVNAEWGCGGVTSQLQVNTRPDLTFPDGNIQVLHDTTGAFASLCGSGQIVLIVRNAGASEVRDVSLSEALNTASTGMALVGGSVEYSTNNGSSWSSAGSVAASSTLNFDSTNIPPLALMGPFGSSSDEVLIRFGITTDARTNSNSTASASGSAVLHCGDAVSSPASGFAVPLDRPEIRVSKTGRNVTTATSLSETVYGRPGDTIEWNVEVRNVGDIATSELRLRDLLAGSGGSATITGGGLTNEPVTTDYIDVDEIASGGTATFTITEILGSTCANGSNVADVTWGCSAQTVGSASEISSPIDNTDDAGLVMRPTAPDMDLDIAMTAAGGAGAPTLNGEVTLTLTNNGAPFTNGDFTVELPAGYVIDTSQTPVFINSDATSDRVTGVSVNAAVANTPVIELNGGGGWVRNGAEISVTFPVVATGLSDAVSDEDVRVETTSDGTDPAPLADGTARVTLDFESACADAGSVTDTVTIDPKTPDLDIDITDPLARVVSGTGDTTSINVVVTNNGDTQADNGSVSILTGAGWSGSAPTGCTGSMPGTLTCSLDGASALGTGASRTFTLDLTVANETSPLSVEATVEGDIEDAIGTDTGVDFSLDAIAARVLGFRQTLDLFSTSETDFDAPADLQIGEDGLLRLTSVWFGGGSETISNVSIDLDFEASDRFAYLSQTGSAIASSLLASGATGPTQTYTLANFTGSLTHVLDIAVRALDDTANTSGATFDFVSEASSDFLGSTFDASAADYPLVAGRTETLTTDRPVLEAVKTVRNVTASGTFAETATGDAGDVIEFRVVISNSGSAPLFDLDITDAMPTGLTPVAFAADTLDNDGDGSTDEASEGDVDDQDLTFNTTESGGTQFDSLAAGASVTLLYRATVDATVNPAQMLVNDAKAEGDTLAGATGSQSAPTGGNGTALGAAELTAEDTATLTIDALALTKSLVITSVGGDDSTDVVVGEQADFQLQIVLPAGTVEDFIVEDGLPDGLALVARQAPAFGSGISCGSSTIAPATLPETGPSLIAQWNFGTCTVADTTSENRTLTLVYTGQVENAAAVNDGDDLPNLARYNHSRVAEAVEIAPVTLSVGEPDLTLALTVSPATNVDAGDVLTWTYTLQNTGTAPAYNVDLVSLLNDNGVADGADGDVNTTANFGDALRDIIAFDCALTPTDTTSTPGDFVYSFDAGDGDGDANDEPGDCETLYRNISVDGLAAGASLTFSFEATTAEDITLRTSLIGAGAVSGTSLPAGAPGQGDTTYERTSGADASNGGRYGDAVTSGFVTRTPAGSQKTFTATSDANTSPDSGDAIDVAIGETYTARITYRFDEGTSRSANLRNRVRVRNANNPADVELLAARLERSSTDITAAGDPSGINAAGAGVPVDVTSLMTQSENASYTFFNLSLGDVVNAGNAGAPETGRNIDTFTVEYDFRVLDVASNAVGAFIDDQGQTRLRDGEDTQLTNGGETRRATIVEPDISVSKTSADSDGLLTGGETVRYTLTASNASVAGAGPAYNALLQDVLPPALRANGVSPVSILIDGASPASAPTFSYNASSGLAQWSFSDADVLLPGQSIVIIYDATADAVISPGTTHTNMFEVAAVYSQASSQPIERRQSPRSPQASVTLGAPEIAFYPDQRETTQPGTTIIYPHLMDIPTSLAGATLDFSSTSSRSLGWEVWYDSDGNGALSGGDTLWVNGSAAPTGETLQFFVRSQIPADAQDGYRDSTTFAATVTLGSTVLTQSVTDITTVSRLSAGELKAGKFMALDRDCDGSLTDELPTDASFEITKNAEPGDCVVFRITYRNDGTGQISDVDVRDQVPAYTLYRSGTAAFEMTPSGLTPGTLTAPADGTRGALAFPYTGTVEPGEEGSVVYGVRVEE
ncbi:MAG: hypothetical protein AAF216_03290 [Pseudomonadota bacterium]